MLSSLLPLVYRIASKVHHRALVLGTLCSKVRRLHGNRTAERERDRQKRVECFVDVNCRHARKERFVRACLQHMGQIRRRERERQTIFDAQEEWVARASYRCVSTIKSWFTFSLIARRDHVFQP